MARTILVVDDETTHRETLVDALELEGYRAIPAADGREALQKFRAEHPDLVLLDLMLPELSGVEVCRILRAESSVPIIMLTARDGEVDKVVGLELGADDYVTKPFSLRELTARIRAIFRRAEQAAATQAPPVVDLGRVQVDLAGHRVLRDGQPLPIKPKAFELLAFLVRHPGQVFTPRPAPRARLGLRLRGRDPDGRRPRALAALGARGGPVDAAVPPHGPRRGLRVPAPRRLSAAPIAPGPGSARTSGQSMAPNIADHDAVVARPSRQARDDAARRTATRISPPAAATIAATSAPTSAASSTAISPASS